MGRYWYLLYEFPVSFPTDPLSWDSEKFDNLFIRTKIYDQVDIYLAHIKKQYGKFWVSSPSGGYGKSTLLNYISRVFYQRISDWRVIPFHLHVSEKLYDSVKHTFIRNFLDELSKLDQNLKRARKVLKVNVPDEINKQVIEGFDKFRKGIDKFRVNLPKLNTRELEAKFYLALERVLQPWIETGIFNKYVLLIDEMDKLDPNDILTFLSGNQHLFEQLYGKYEFVAYFSGHRSWVEKIREGTEYSYYHGTVFNLQPFIDLEDVKRLIESRLITYLYMSPADNPWTESGLKKLLEVTGGAPRKLLEMAAKVMNNAYRKKASSIGPGIIEEALIGEEYIQIARNYLSTHFQTYIKLRQAISKKVDNLLYIFHEMPRHQIPKKYDQSMAERTTHLGIELSDDEWTSSIRTLINLECIQDGGVVRELSPDIVEFLDKFSDCPAEIQRVIRAVIRGVGEIKPSERIIPPPPNYKEIINRIFENSKGEWLSEDEVFDRFFSSTKVQMYVKQRRPKQSKQFAKRIFVREFKRYLAEAHSSLMVFEEKGKIFYQKLPPELPKHEYEQLKKFRSRSFIDTYINLVLKQAYYDENNIIKLDTFIEDIFKKICRLRTIRFDDGTLRKKRRYELFKRLQLPADLRRHLDFYLRESKEATPRPGIIKETLRAIILSLAEIYDKLSPTPEEGVSKEDYNMLRTIEGTLRICVEKELSKLSTKWWKERIPPDVRKNAEKRKAESELPWPWCSKEDNPLYYVNFSDYRQIIVKRDNWRECFKHIFKNKTQIEASLERLESIRNAVAHNRPLTEDQRRVLITEMKFICNSIKAVKNKAYG